VTASEASELTIDLVRELAATRSEAAAWRLLALTAIHHTADLAQQLEIVDRRSHVHRRHIEAQRAPSEVVAA
jgi:hypothetical protein